MQVVVERSGHMRLFYVVIVVIEGKSKYQGSMFSPRFRSCQWHILETIIAEVLYHVATHYHVFPHSTASRSHTLPRIPTLYHVFWHSTTCSHSLPRHVPALYHVSANSAVYSNTATCCVVFSGTKTEQILNRCWTTT